MSESHARTIIHMDLDAFYAQVEIVSNPSLAGKPVGVKQKYLLVTCNQVARAMGAKKMSAVAEAVSIVPSLIVLDGSDLTKYRAASAAIMRIVTAYCPAAQRIALDEVYLDASEQVADLLADAPALVLGTWHGHVHGDPATAATDCGGAPEPDGSPCACARRLQVASALVAEIRAAVFQDLGYTTCGGVGVSKLAAKQASSMHKPNQQTTLLPAATADYIAPLHVSILPGVGYRTRKQLAEAHINTVADLRKVPVQMLSTMFDESVATRLAELARGIDTAEVAVSQAPQQITEEDSFKRCTTFDDATARMRDLLQSLIARIDEHIEQFERYPTTLRLSIRRLKHTRESRQAPLPTEVFDKAASRLDVLVNACMTLLRRMVGPGSFHLTLINVGVTQFGTTKPAPSVTAYFGAGAPGAAFAAAGAPSAPTPSIPPAADMHSPPLAPPPGIDPAVFAELPYAIQQELVQAGGLPS